MRSILAPLFALTIIGGCGGDSPPPTGVPDDAQAPVHDHHGHAHDPHAQVQLLGELSLGDARYRVEQHGDFIAGAELGLGVTPLAGAQTDALRAWIGAEDGRGSVKALLDRDGEHFHGHVAIPLPLPEGSALWLEAERAGTRARASLALPQPDGHRHEHGDGHDHGAHEH